MLSASIIDHLQQNRKGVLPPLFFLCDKFDDQKRSPLSIIATFLAHIILHSIAIPPQLVKAFEAARRYGRSQISESDGAKLLLRAIMSVESSIDIVIDGIDEMHDAPRMLELLNYLLTYNKGHHVIALSRDYLRIRKALTTALHIDVVQSQMNEDIASYIRLSIEQSMIEDTRVRDEVISSFVEKADRSFLWASLVLEEVAIATSFSEIDRTTKELPKGLEVAYAEILSKLLKKSASSLKLFRTTFLWICCSWRPLTW